MTKGSTNVVITEVSLRDGLQELDFIVASAHKAALVREYRNAGLDHIELTSFVRPERVPQLADAEELSRIVAPGDHSSYSALVPNLTGLRRAAACGFHRVTVVLSASEAHSQSNLGCDVGEGLNRARDVILGAKAFGMCVRAAISMAFGCPVEGEVPVERVAGLAAALAAVGADEVSLADTAGVATPADVALRASVTAEITGMAPSLHLHDRTRSGLANVMAGFEAGVRHFDASLTGMGGCPFAPDPVGNISTEEIVAALGVATGLDPVRIEAAADSLRSVLMRARTENQRVERTVRATA